MSQSPIFVAACCVTLNQDDCPAQARPDQIRQMDTVSHLFLCVCNCVIAAQALLCLTASRHQRSLLTPHLNSFKKSKQQIRNPRRPSSEILCKADNGVSQSSLASRVNLCYLWRDVWLHSVVMRSAVNINCVPLSARLLISSYKRGEEMMAEGRPGPDNLWDPVILLLSPHTYSRTVTNVNVSIKTKSLF